MGYDLHIVRTSDWQEETESPITEEEVIRLVESDPDLEWSASDYVEMKIKDEVSLRYSTKRQMLIKWREISCFWWHQGEVICKNPTEDQITKMSHMAQTLNAQVIGDDGERYTLRRSLFGREKVEILQP